jgi:hypothetical protein
MFLAELLGKLLLLRNALVIFVTGLLFHALNIARFFEVDRVFHLSRWFLYCLDVIFMIHF